MFKFILLLFYLFFINAYDENLSKHCVNLSQAAYCVNSLDQWTCITCDRDVLLEYIVDINQSKAIQGYDKYTNTIFTSFRGSSNIHNWIENIQFRKISPYNNSNIEIERGFYKEYNFIKKNIIENLFLLSKKYNTNKLLITGHSSGAALATIMAYDILKQYNEYKIAYLFNFGSPRVGNKEFVEDFNNYNITSYRITHYYDMVPHVPEEFLGYHHISNEIWYNRENLEYIICNDFDNLEDSKCSNSCSPLHCTSTSDHLYYLNVTMGYNDGASCYLNID
jgi:hypothetical protein